MSEATLDLRWDDAQQALADAVARFCGEQCTDAVAALLAPLGL